MDIGTRMDGAAVGKEGEEGGTEGPRQDTNAGNDAEDARAAGLDIGMERLEGDVDMTVVGNAQAVGVESRSPAPGRAGAGVAYGKFEDGIETAGNGWVRGAIWFVLEQAGPKIVIVPGREVVTELPVAMRDDARCVAGAVRTLIATAAATAMMMLTMMMLDARTERGVLPGERGHCHCRNGPLWGLSIE